jgi:hypothetical protein
MNANWNLPALTSSYANFLAEMKSRDEDLAIWFDDTTSTNLTVGTKRWNSIGAKFEEWGGTAWSDLSTLYEIKVRDSDKLNGQTASYYAVSNHGHSAVTTTANGFMSYTDKIKLNAIAANANNYSHPTGDGNLHVPANGTANNGKFLQATSVAGVYSWASLPATSLSTLGINATAAELNILDGCLITVTQLNYLSALSGNVQNQLNAKAPLASPAFTGTPTLPTGTTAVTQVAGTNNTTLATTAFVLANSDVATATTVGNATAGIALGAVGSYATVCKTTSTNAIHEAGTTVAGSSLYFAGKASAGSGQYSTTPLPTGTWRIMGRLVASAGSGDLGFSLALRIA